MTFKRFANAEALFSPLADTKMVSSYSLRSRVFAPACSSKFFSYGEPGPPPTRPAHAEPCSL